MLPSRPTNGATVSVLVADDDDGYRHAVRQTLESWNLGVVEAGDGLEAWRLLEQDRSIHLAIVNWLLPKLDGYCLCRRLYEYRRGEIGAVMMVGESFVQEVCRRLPDDGAVCLAKPFDGAQLRRSLLSAGWMLARVGGPAA